MDIQVISNQRRTIQLVAWISRTFTPRPAQMLIRHIAGLIARRKSSSLVRTIRQNQGIVAGLPIDDSRLDNAVLAVLRHAGLCYYNYYRRLAGKSDILDSITLPEDLAVILDADGRQGRGLVVATAHLSNFDLAGAVIANKGYTLQALSYPVPPGGYEYQNEMRREQGIIVTPTSGEAVKQAIRRLRQGGIVVVGADRPVPEAKQTAVRFFGQPTTLPTGYVRLAQTTNAQLVYSWVEQTGEGRYNLRINPPVQLEQTGDRRADLICNVEKVLQQVQRSIQAHPEQWLMFFPVWPEFAHQPG